MAAETHAQNGDPVQSGTSPISQSAPNAELAKEEVGWYFVERYYNTLSKNPEKLYLLYNKRSQFVAGVEEEKVHVSIGLKAIDDRVKELNYQDCKVRITNVDSQSSDVNIVVQVIGEMTNEAKPHRKFCQTFVLAPQPHGYFLLNDILRFIADEDDEPIELQTEPDLSASSENVADEANDSLDEQSMPTGETADVQRPPASEIEEQDTTNGNAALSVDSRTVEETNSDVADTTEPTKSTAEQGHDDSKIEAKEVVSAESTTKEASPPTRNVTSASKPAVPLSWAQRIGAGNSLKSSVSSSAPVATSVTASTPATKVATGTSSNTKPVSAQSTPPVSGPARQPSPTDSTQDGSQGGWQTAGTDHGKTKPRSIPTTTDNSHVRAYVKNVFQSVTTEALKAELSKYGELAYFDVSRQKNSAFVEFSSIDAFKACIAANPHKIGDDSIIVEERRPAPSFGTRGPNRGGRGGAYDGRQGPNRGGYGNKEGAAARGGFNGPRGGRGVSSSVAGRGRPQAV